MRIPDSPVLKVALAWMAVFAASSIALANYAPADASGALGAFFTRMVLPYISGAFGSACGVIRVAGLAAAILFATTILVERFQSRQTAHLAFSTFMLLSLLTIWCDDYLVCALNPLFSLATAEAAASVGVSALVDSIMIPLDLGATAVWVFLWVLVVREADAELLESRSRREQAREYEVLLRESFESCGSGEPAVRALPVATLDCAACGAGIPSTNRFCTRCGAPLIKPPASRGGE